MYKANLKVDCSFFFKQTKFGDPPNILEIFQYLWLGCWLCRVELVFTKNCQRYKFSIPGQPSPHVTWSINDSEVLRDSLMMTQCPGSSSPAVQVTMSITPPSLVVSRFMSPCLPASLAGAKLSCIASNNNISLPAVSSVYLNVLGEIWSKSWLF